VAAEPQRTDLRIRLVESFHNLYVAAPQRADACDWLFEIVATLRRLRESGVREEKIEELWELASDARAR